REVTATDCPTEKRSDRRGRREHGDAKHAVATEQTLDVEVLAENARAPPQRGLLWPHARHRREYGGARRTLTRRWTRRRSAGGERRAECRDLVGERRHRTLEALDAILE